MKKAMVTGASRGIGMEIACMLAREGYDLYLICRHSEQKLYQLKKELEDLYGIACKAILCDVADPQSVERSLKGIEDVELLVNNAAVSHVGLLSEMSVTQWQRVIGTNLNAVFYLSKIVIPGMIRRKQGKIINISSVWGSAGASMEVAYSASKGGVNSFTKALAKELAPSNIQVNAAAFGVIKTEMNSFLSEEEMNDLLEEIPADRIGSAEEAALMVRQILQSPDYFTGQIVTMDGGWT